MSEPNANRKEALLLELDLHKTEFSALRDEVIHLIDAEKQVLNISLVAAGAGISVLSLIDQNSLYIVLLLFPFVFHVILWEMLNSIKALSAISSYLTTTLIPRVNAILDELGSQRKEVIVLGWEIQTAKTSAKPLQLLFTSLTPTRHWMPILAVAGLLLAYTVMIQANQHTPSSNEVALLLINLILLLWAAFQNLFTVRSYIKRTQPSLMGGERKKPAANPKLKRPAPGVKPRR